MSYKNNYFWKGREREKEKREEKGERVDPLQAWVSGFVTAFALMQIYMGYRDDRRRTRDEAIARLKRKYRS